MSNNQSQIYAMGYEKWEGDRERATPAFWLIGTSSLRNLVSSSGCFARFKFITFFVIYYTGLLLYTLVHFQLDSLKQYAFFASIGEVLEQIGTTESQYHRVWIIYTSLYFTCFACLFYGSQLISKDKRANAMQVYFSKAISRRDYFLGKFLAIGILTSTVTLVPSALILLMGVFLATDHLSFFQNSWYIPFQTGAYWLVLTASIGSVCLMFSSFFTKAYMAGVSIIGFLMFFTVFSMIATNVLGAGPMLGGTNWITTILDLSTVIFEFKVSDWPKFIWQVIDIGLLITGCSFMILRNIRPVEVVS